eukprot:353460-Chlamydomonas_euryale.AAC.17
MRAAPQVGYIASLKGVKSHKIVEQVRWRSWSLPTTPHSRGADERGSHLVTAIAMCTSYHLGPTAAASTARTPRIVNCDRGRARSDGGDGAAVVEVAIVGPPPPSPKPWRVAQSAYACTARCTAAALQALTALGCMEHRGACSADDDSGDGAGLMTDIPWKLIKKEFPDVNEVTTGCVCSDGAGAAVAWRDCRPPMRPARRFEPTKFNRRSRRARARARALMRVLRRARPTWPLP